MPPKTNRRHGEKQIVISNLHRDINLDIQHQVDSSQRFRRLSLGTLKRGRERRQTAPLELPLARWSSSLGHWPPSHHLLFRISSLLFSCNWRIASVISSLNGEPGKRQENGMKSRVGGTEKVQQNSPNERGCI